MTCARRFAGPSALLVLLGVLATPVALDAQPRLVILAETGEARGSIPVLKVHPDAGRVASTLTRGFSARMLRLYQLQQAYLANISGSRPEPAYLLLSSRQGGFPVVGFWLGPEDKRQASFVDLYKGSTPAGRFGAMDQIFPHELGHVIVRQLAGEPRRGGSSQMHAVGVRTDPIQAFSEGFAEHFQVMALDDPDADPATAAVLADPFWRRRTERELEDYRRELTARWAPATSRRATFPLWFSANEQVLRYYGVKANLFARDPQLAEHLLNGGDAYAAYLLENILPGRANDPAKPVARLLSTEGVVAALFWRWATSADLQNRFLDRAFYAQFGTTAADVPPAINVYLKLLHVIHQAKPDTTMALVDAYRRTWPEEAPFVDRLLSDVLLGQTPRPASEIWLANTAFRVGTTMFDQWRAAPIVHTFDLNAASVVDLVSVPGVDRALARQILGRLPVQRIHDLRGVPGMTAEVERRFEEMAAAMARGRSEPEEETISRLAPVLWAYPKRAALMWLAAAATAALLIRRLTARRWARAALNGLAASLVTLVAGWITWPSVAAVVASTVVFGVPAAWIARRRGDSWRRAALVASSWLAAAAPAWLLLTPLF
jgi:hypothetical protein